MTVGPTPTTTRLGGGRSAWVGAVVVLSLLGGLIWVGVSGRPSAPSQPVADASGTQLPSGAAATPSTIRTPQTPVPGSRPAAGAPKLDHFSLVATLGASQSVANLHADSTGDLSGEASLVIPKSGTNGTLELDQVWITMSHDSWVTLGTWNVRLEVPMAAGADSVLLDRLVPARPSPSDAPQPVVLGYRIVVHARAGSPRGSLKVDISVGLRHQLVGDDGNFGWPTVAQIAGLRIKRGVGLYNRCRWDVGPQAGRPGPSHDEASCE